MGMRQLGGTELRVGVLGPGGGEIGFERAEPEAVAHAARQYAGRPEDAHRQPYGDRPRRLDHESPREG